jgi:transcriptional regulator with XRE-family HTH domain
MQRMNPIDVLVGERIRVLRLQHNISQAELGAAIGTTVGEIEQFETGARRIGVSRLSLIASVLDVDVEIFFIRANESIDADTLYETGGGKVRASSRSLH